jgi:hypothetical protein
VSEWYTLDNGQQRGPFKQETLAQLVASGQLKPTDMVRPKEASAWVPATSIGGLFPNTPAAQPHLTATPPGPPPLPNAAHVPMWHYVMNGQQYGPIPEESLKQLVSTGQLRPTDLVWKAGMSSWMPAGTLSSAAPPFAPPAPAPANSLVWLWVALALVPIFGVCLIIACLSAITVIGQKANRTFITVGSSLTTGS